MALNEALLAEFEQEAAGTRKSLERVPSDKFDWKPHQKSWTFSQLAHHLATLAGWATVTINTDSLDIMPEGGPPPRPPVAETREELLGLFDRCVAEAKAAIAGASDEDLMKPWSLVVRGKVTLTLPKIAILRSFVFSHSIHHRGQLTVYLRMNDVPVPSLYGPSADEGALGF
ncbi:MAG: damage-inducible protein DinB [Bryobacterales bacterium]|nr:damage-inducible protein DinB [Bryobacterales bacterium]